MRRGGRAPWASILWAAGLGAAVVLAGVFFLSGPRPVSAQNEEDRLEEVERRLTDLRRRIDAARTERTELADDIEETEVRMAGVKAALAEAETALAEAETAVVFREESVADLGRRIRLLDAELAGTRLEKRLTLDLVRERGVELYMSASAGVDGAFLGSEDFNAASIRVQYMRDLLADTEVLLRSLELVERQELERQDRLSEEREQETSLLGELEVELARAEEHRTVVDAAREELLEELRRQEGLLARVTEDISDHEGHVEALEAESERLALEILRRQVREGRAPGRLAWPVGGSVTSPFGWRIHPILGGRRMHNGLDQRAATGDPIHAAANGRVILAEWWGGYGRTVVIDHGGGLATLYAHQSSIAVSVDEDVLAGDVIGYIGCTGYCTGPHLHFEVRELGEPVDPMLYLG